MRSESPKPTSAVATYAGGRIGRGHDCVMSASNIVVSGDPAIDARAVSFTYPGADRAAVRGITFAVHRREIFGFLGPSGAGKSTTQNVLIRLLDAYQGQIAVLGKDLGDWDRSYYRHIGVSFEAPNHYLN